MKRLAILWKLLLIPLMLAAQIDIDFVGYKASDALFYMEAGKMIASINQQYKVVKFLEKPTYMDIGTSNDNLVARCIDNGGYTCSFYIVFTPASENKIGGKDVYTIVIGYSSVLFIYECYKTDERPWKEDPLDIKNLVNQNNIYRTNPNYSDEEIEKFFDQFWNGKLIKNAIVQDFTIEFSETARNLNFNR